MFTIESDQLLVQVNPKGAELDQVLHKKLNLDYLWNADPAFWPKKSPVLFPIVGTLKDNEYLFNGKAYPLSRHGFAREKEFMLTAQANDSITLTLKQDDSTRKVYPFDFIFSITYSVHKDELHVEYRVINPGTEPLYFSLGGHPAFRLPIDAALSYSDYYIEMEKEEDAGRWQISPAGLIEDHSTPLLDHSNILPLTHELFFKDAIVFKNLASQSLTLRSDHSEHGLKFSFPGFPFLGIWAVKNADFVCIEPWCGIADSVNTNKDFTQKEGIEWLAGDTEFVKDWKVRFF